MNMKVFVFILGAVLSCVSTASKAIDLCDHRYYGDGSYEDSCDTCSCSESQLTCTRCYITDNPSNSQPSNIDLTTCIYDGTYVYVANIQGNLKCFTPSRLNKPQPRQK